MKLIRTCVWSQVESEVSVQVGGMLGSRVYWQTTTQVRDQVWTQLKSNEMVIAGRQVREYVADAHWMYSL